MSLDDLHKWDAKYTNREGVPDQPSAALADLANWLPSDGRGLDIAGGAGRNAIWLARRGLKVTVADVSPVGLSLAKQRAADAGVEIEAVCCDLDNPANLPAGPCRLLPVPAFDRGDS
jgi:tellurite methyltransferase